MKSKIDGICIEWLKVHIGGDNKKAMEVKFSLTMDGSPAGFTKTIILGRTDDMETNVQDLAAAVEREINKVIFDEVQDDDGEGAEVDLDWELNADELGFD